MRWLDEEANKNPHRVAGALLLLACTVASSLTAVVWAQTVLCLIFLAVLCVAAIARCWPTIQEGIDAFRKGWVDRA